MQTAVHAAASRWKRKQMLVRMKSMEKDRCVYGVPGIEGARAQTKLNKLDRNFNTIYWNCIAFLHSLHSQSNPFPISLRASFVLSSTPSLPSYADKEKCNIIASINFRRQLKRSLFLCSTNDIVFSVIQVDRLNRMLTKQEKASLTARMVWKCERYGNYSLQK